MEWGHLNMTIKLQNRNGAEDSQEVKKKVVCFILCLSVFIVCFLEQVYVHNKSLDEGDVKQCISL